MRAPRPLPAGWALPSVVWDSPSGTGAVPPCTPHLVWSLPVLPASVGPPKGGVGSESLLCPHIGHSAGPQWGLGGYLLEERTRERGFSSGGRPSWGQKQVPHPTAFDSVQNASRAPPVLCTEPSPPNRPRLPSCSLLPMARPPAPGVGLPCQPEAMVARSTPGLSLSIRRPDLVPGLGSGLATKPACLPLNLGGAEGSGWLWWGSGWDGRQAFRT